MSPSSTSVLPDVNTNKSLRAASLCISTCTHGTKFVSGGNHNRKGTKGSRLSGPRESSSTSQTLDRHLITVCPRSICKWQGIITLNQSSDRMLVAMTFLQYHVCWNLWQYCAYSWLLHRVATNLAPTSYNLILLSISSLSCCWISINSCPVTPHHNKLPVTPH